MLFHSGSVIASAVTIILLPYYYSHSPRLVKLDATPLIRWVILHYNNLSSFFQKHFSFIISLGVVNNFWACYYSLHNHMHSAHHIHYYTHMHYLTHVLLLKLHPVYRQKWSLSVIVRRVLWYDLSFSKVIARWNSFLNSCL